MSDYITLGEVSSIKGGSGFPEIYQGQKSGDYPFIKVSDMNLPSNARNIIDANNYVNIETVNTLSLSIFHKNTLVFAKVGAAVYLKKRRPMLSSSIRKVVGFGSTVRLIGGWGTGITLLGVENASEVRHYLQGKKS